MVRPRPCRIHPLGFAMMKPQCLNKIQRIQVASMTGQGLHDLPRRDLEFRSSHSRGIFFRGPWCFILEGIVHDMCQFFLFPHLVDEGACGVFAAFDDPVFDPIDFVSISLASIHVIFVELTFSTVVGSVGFRAGHDHFFDEKGAVACLIKPPPDRAFKVVPFSRVLLLGEVGCRVRVVGYAVDYSFHWFTYLLIAPRSDAGK